ncbi:hypothetical protein ACF09H_10940 [Streptomyces sp. NPDC014983]
MAKESVHISTNPSAKPEALAPPLGMVKTRLRDGSDSSDSVTT